MIHPLAHVAENVTLGHGTRVWQFASVIREAVLGKDCNVGSCAIVDAAHLGDGCLIGHGASVHPGARVGQGVFIGPGAVVCNDLWPRTDKAGFDVADLIAGRVTVRIEDGASIGAHAVVLPGVVVGKGAMVAAGSVVSRDVPEGFLWGRLGDMEPIRSKTPERMRPARC